MATICDGHKGSISFLTTMTVLRVRSIGGQRMHRDIIDDTALADTYEVSCPGSLQRHDEFECEIIHDDDTANKMKTLLAAAKEQIRVSYPVGEGQTDPATKTASGFVASYTDPPLETGSNLIGTLSVKFSGDITHVDGSLTP